MATLLFDFDGLILDTETPEVLAWEWLFAENRQIYPRAFWQNLVGKGPDQVDEKPAELLKRMAELPESEEEIFAKFRERYFLILKKTPRPGIELLLYDAAQAGVQMAIVSSSDREWVTGHLTDLGLKDVFSHIITREDAPRSKPAPDLYLEAVGRMNLSSEETWVLEDSYNGMIAAKAAELRVLVYPNPTTKHLDFSAADLVIPDLENFALSGFGF
jgi:HAD superfamily hydrolase (TIGR01509 family)